MNNEFHIFLKKGETFSIDGKQFSDRDCILTTQDIQVVRQALGSIIDMAVSAKQFKPQQHSHRFDNYKYLPEISPNGLGGIKRFNVEPYQDCVLVHKDGSKRIGRIQKSGKGDHDFFNLASYQDRKCNVVWPIKDVVKATPINYDM